MIFYCNDILWQLTATASAPGGVEKTVTSSVYNHRDKRQAVDEPDNIEQDQLQTNINAINDNGQ